MTTYDLKDRIRELREGHFMSQQDLAAKVGVTFKQISSYERGIHQPTYETLIRIADLFKVTTDYLLCCEGKMLDISGLTQKEERLITELIGRMSEKNIALGEANGKR